MRVFSLDWNFSSVSQVEIGMHAWNEIRKTNGAKIETFWHETKATIKLGLRKGSFPPRLEKIVIT